MPNCATRSRSNDAGINGVQMGPGATAFTRGTITDGTNPLTGDALDNTPADNITPSKLVANARFTDTRGRWWLEYGIRAQGRVDRVITLPVPRPTSCMFGGPDLGTLFVTSARIRLSAAQLAESPLSGSVFAIDTGGVRGLPEPAFAG